MFEGFTDYAIAGNGVEVTFNSGTADANGSYWYLDGEVVGWDSPDGRVTMLTKIGSDPDADGEYPADQHYRGRTFTFTLYANCTSEENRQKSRYLLAQALDLVDSTGTFTGNENIPKFCTISRSGNNNQGKLVMTDAGLSGPVVSTPGFPVCQTDENGLVYLLKADVEFYAEDPRKYAVTPDGPSPIESNSITLDAVGNTTTQNFVVNITGDISGITGPLTITLNGKTMSLVVPTLPLGAPALSDFPATLAVDFYNKTIEDADGNNYYYLRDLTTPWLTLPPGSHAMTFVPPTGDVDGSVTFYDAWI